MRAIQLEGFGGSGTGKCGSVDSRFKDAAGDRRGAVDRSGSRGLSRASANLGSWAMVVPER
jgi:hypothetical protein